MHIRGLEATEICHCGGLLELEHERGRSIGKHSRADTEEFLIIDSIECNDICRKLPLVWIMCKKHNLSSVGMVSRSLSLEGERGLLCQ